MITKKTAVLLSCALQLGAIIAGADDGVLASLNRFGIHLGLAFQLQDDYLDSYGDIAVFGKQTMQDIVDNKKTYMMLKAMELADNHTREELLRLFSTSPQEESGIKAKLNRVISIYDCLHLRQVAQQAIDDEFRKADAALAAISAPDDLKKPLADLKESLIGRKK